VWKIAKDLRRVRPAVLLQECIQAGGPPVVTDLIQPLHYRPERGPGVTRSHGNAHSLKAGGLRCAPLVQPLRVPCQSGLAEQYDDCGPSDADDHDEPDCRSSMVRVAWRFDA
jgi:hypothetical protein